MTSESVGPVDGNPNDGAGDGAADGMDVALDEDAVSIVMPAYDEVGNLEGLLEEIQRVFEGGAAGHPLDEVVIVDDGSTDGTTAVLREMATRENEVRGVLCRRNFGQSAALAAGIDHAHCDVIVTMDADGQNDPADIPRLLDELDGGYDCVSGWRRDRSDPIAKQIPSTIQQYLARATGPSIRDFGCTLKAYREDAIQDVDLYGEGHRYIPAELYRKGYRITEIPVSHRPRTSGETKYGASRLVKGVLDLVFHVFWNRFSTRPLHFLGGVALAFLGVGGTIGVHAVILKYAYGVPLRPRMPRLILVIGLVLFGFQLLIFGFLAEMITNLRLRGERPYRIEEVVE